MDKAHHNLWCGNGYPWAGNGTFSWGFCLVFRAIQLIYLQLVLKVMYYDVEANKEMRLYIEKVVNAAGEKTKLEMELFTERQIQNGIKEIRRVVKEEVQNEMRIKDGGKEK